MSRSTARGGGEKLARLAIHMYILFAPEGCYKRQGDSEWRDE